MRTIIMRIIILTTRMTSGRLLLRVDLDGRHVHDRLIQALAVGVQLGVLPALALVASRRVDAILEG